MRLESIDGELVVFWLLVMVMMFRLCCRFGIVLVVGVVDVGVVDGDDVVMDLILLVFWIELGSDLLFELL